MHYIGLALAGGGIGWITSLLHNATEPRENRTRVLVALFMFCIGLPLATHPTDTARYELETGEYLRCTPEGGNQLACEVKHRSETP